ncbi:MAG: DUF4259 domain-containing protein [Flavobacteriales bacterium]|nr:DUF4259 domain-containing protein [Flavobacteriales bacterium]
MGAWDTGIFDDDTAYDVLASLAIADPMAQINEWYAAVKGVDYLEYTDCQCLLVSGAVIDAALNGTTYRCDDEETLAKVVSEVTKHDPASLKGIAVENLQRVLSDISELRELWEENVELYPVWRANIEAIIGRLN